MRRAKTVANLDALPLDSIILDACGCVFQKLMREDGTIGWFMADVRGEPAIVPDDILIYGVPARIFRQPRRGWQTSRWDWMWLR